ncbi:unnamed protein product [Moneuplotes crassus]|uniref:Uncharacterized protein n=1 Tax=Euplotes crassus TaxID=5936 RepID=A0AAD2D8M8_EUPCR|nr:unnamed protein product [Moneuplotes crassus]
MNISDIEGAQVRKLFRLKTRDIMKCRDIDGAYPKIRRKHYKDYAFDDYSDVTRNIPRLTFLDKLSNNSQISHYKRLLKNRIQSLKDQSYILNGQNHSLFPKEKVTEKDHRHAPKRARMQKLSRSISNFNEKKASSTKENPNKLFQNNSFVNYNNITVEPNKKHYENFSKKFESLKKTSSRNERLNSDRNGKKRIITFNKHSPTTKREGRRLLNPQALIRGKNNYTTQRKEPEKFNFYGTENLLKASVKATKFDMNMINPIIRKIDSRKSTQCSFD